MLAVDRSALRQKPIPRVLSRHHLLMGAEREPLLVCAFTLGGVAMTSMNFVAALVCGALWLVALTALRWMAKVDPQMTLIYRRSLRYRRYYPAFSRPFRKF